MLCFGIEHYLSSSNYMDCISSVTGTNGCNLNLSLKGSDLPELFSKLGLGKYTDVFQQQEVMMDRVFVNDALSVWHVRSFIHSTWWLQLKPWKFQHRAKEVQWITKDRLMPELSLGSLNSDSSQHLIRELWSRWSWHKIHASFPFESYNLTDIGWPHNWDWIEINEILSLTQLDQEQNIFVWSQDVFLCVSAPLIQLSYIHNIHITKQLSIHI